MPGKATCPQGTPGLGTAKGDFSLFRQPIYFPPFHPPALPLHALTQACCTPVSLSLCHHHRFLSRSQKGSTSPTLHLSLVPPAPWARTSQTGSAACKREMAKDGFNLHLHYELTTSDPSSLISQPFTRRSKDFAIQQN